MGGASTGTSLGRQGHPPVGIAGWTELLRRPESTAVTWIFSCWNLLCFDGRMSPAPVGRETQCKCVGTA